MTPNKLRIANSLMSDIDMCKHQILSMQISLRELSALNQEDDKLQIRVLKRSIAIEQDKQVALEREFKNL